MKSKKIIRLISLIIVLSLIFTSTVFADPKFKGVKKNNFKWNKSAYYMKNKGIMKGYGNGDFGFTDYVKRGDITVMIVRAFQISRILSEIEEKFPDVPVDSYYYEAIATAKYYNIARGDGKNFNPKKFVTIKDAIALVERSAKVANKHVKVHNVDLNKLFSKKDMKSYATRDDIAKMLYYVLTGDIYEDDVIVLDEIKYEIKREKDTVKFVEKDLKKVLNELDDDFIKDDFDYVKFELPDEKYGKLYYNYRPNSTRNSLVTESKEYNVEDFGKITFVQNNDYAGEVVIEYTVYDDNGNPYAGIIKINIEEELVLDEIKYEIKRENDTVKFVERNLMRALNKIDKDFIEDDFAYVKFELPDEKYGKLYYNYRPNSTRNSLVTESKEYNLEDFGKITFVQNNDYAGEVVIEYTVYDDNGNPYAGIIKINIEEEIVLDTINYTITSNKDRIKFDEDDFEEAIGEVVKDFDEDEYSVKFVLPDEKYGKLYYDYKSSSKNNSLVIDTKNYEFDELDKITFVANSKYKGYVYIEYRAIDEDGNSYAGQVRINVR